MCKKIINKKCYFISFSNFLFQIFLLLVFRLAGLYCILFKLLSSRPDRLTWQFTVFQFMFTANLNELEHNKVSEWCMCVWGVADMGDESRGASPGRSFGRRGSYKTSRGKPQCFAVSAWLLCPESQCCGRVISRRVGISAWHHMLFLILIPHIFTRFIFPYCILLKTHFCELTVKRFKQNII